MIKWLFSFLLASVALSAQEKLRWSTFERLAFKEVYNEEYAEWLMEPQWTEQEKNYEGKQIRITGYVIALDVLNDSYAISAFPFASCFFCGAAGPESVMELKLAEPQEFITDEVHTFSGTLQLNNGGIDFPFTLLNAKVWEE